MSKIHIITPGRQITVDTIPALNLLGHAQLEECEIGSRCGGHGVCGGDRVQVTVVTGAVSPLTEREREHLSADEIAGGVRLGCQCFPETETTELRIKVSKSIF